LPEGPYPPDLEEARGGIVGALEDGVVDGEAVDPAVGGEQLQVAGELLDTVDLTEPPGSS
jgi:hypothetical protein